MNVNKVFISGRVTKEPQLQYSANTMPFAVFTVANRRSWKDKNGDWQEETSFIDAIVWGTAAERFVERIGKGDLVLVEGRLKQEVWEKDGTKHYRTRVVAEKIHLVRKKSSTEDKGVEDIDDIEF